MKMKKLYDKIPYFNITLIQISIFVLSFTPVIAKKAAFYPINSILFWLLYSAEAMVFFIYAIIWQQVLKINEISIAYANKGTLIIWNIIWAYLIFHESISFQNIAGALLIIIGTTLVVKDV